MPDDANGSRECAPSPTVFARSESSEAIQTIKQVLDCFAYARNDGFNATGSNVYPAAFATVSRWRFITILLSAPR